MEGVGSTDLDGITEYLKKNTFKTIIGEADIRNQKLKKVWTVTSLADPGVGQCTSGACTLRQALTSAVNGDKIVFKSNLGGTIALTAGFLPFFNGDVTVDGAGRITSAGAWSPPDDPSVLDLRPLIVMPGLVDLHAHLPQLPNAGLGSGLDLLTWLDRYIFPLERDFDRSVAEIEAPSAWRAFAAAGTTTVVAYAAVWEDSTDAAFAAAEAHGIRAVIGKVMMDRGTYDADIDPGEILETSLRQVARS